MSNFGTIRPNLAAISVVVILAAAILLTTRKNTDGSGRPDSTQKNSSDGKYGSKPGTKQPDQSGMTNRSNPRDQSKTTTPLDPDAAKSLLDAARINIPDVEERSKYCSDIIRRLCLAGYSNEAWELIEPGFGTVRNSGLGQFFTSAELPESNLLAKIAGVDRTDKITCLMGFLWRFDCKELQKAITSPEFSDFLAKNGEGISRGSLNTAVSASLQLALAKESTGDPGAIFESALELHSKGFLETESLMKMIDGRKEYDPFEKWDLASRIDIASKFNRDVQNIRNGMISAMIKSNAPQAMTRIFETTGEQGFLDANSAIGEWCRIDAQGASDWYRDNQSGLSDVQRSAVASGFFSRALSCQEFDGARQWAQLISDPAIRAQAFDAIDKGMAQSKKK